MKPEATPTAKQEPKRRKSRPLSFDMSEFTKRIIREHPKAMKILR
jgi:hypothetical protein